MKLYWSPRSRSFSAIWLMEETGQPYERVLTDISTGAQKTPEFLAVNPMGKGAEGRRCLYRGSISDRRLCRGALSGREAGAAARRSAPRKIFAMAVLRAKLHRTRADPDLHQDRGAGLDRSLGQFDASVRRAGCGAGKGTIPAGRYVLGRRHHGRFGTEFCDPAVQDGAGTAVVRPLHRRLLGAPGVPAGNGDRGGVTAINPTACRRPPSAHPDAASR